MAHVKCQYWDYFTVDEAFFEKNLRNVESIDGILRCGSMKIGHSSDEKYPVTDIIFLEIDGHIFIDKREDEKHE